MEDEKDYYELLELDQFANNESIKKSYQKLVLKYHPDKVAGLGLELQKLAGEKSKEIIEAYTQLTNYHSR